MSDILRRAVLVNREIFDPTNPEHLESLKSFLRTGSWGSVQFWTEAPFTEIPATVLAKYARYMLGVAVENAEEREARLAAKNVITQASAPSAEESALRLAMANSIVKDLLAKV